MLVSVSKKLMINLGISFIFL